MTFRGRPYLFSCDRCGHDDAFLEPPLTWVWYRENGVLKHACPACKHDPEIKELVVPMGKRSKAHAEGKVQ